MTSFLPHVSISTRRKLTSILLAVTIFALLAGLTSFATRGSIAYAVIDSILVGTCVGLFEQFYVQSLRVPLKFRPSLPPGVATVSKLSPFLKLGS